MRESCKQIDTSRRILAVVEVSQKSYLSTSKTFLSYRLTVAKLSMHYKQDLTACKGLYLPEQFGIPAGRHRTVLSLL